MHRGERGFQLPELMIALAIGLFLIAAFLAALREVRQAFAVNESIAWLQDANRHATSVLVPDIEHAGFYGFAGSGVVVHSLPAGIDVCGAGFATAIDRPVQATNDSWLAAGASCAPTASAGGARPGTDTLTLRRASVTRELAHAGWLQVYSRRLDSQAPLVLFADGRAPGPTDDDRAIRDLDVRTYYISNDSVDRPGVPALRVKALTESRGGAQFRDEEVMPGVEDLQVELGVVDGNRVTFVVPDSPLARAGAVVAVKFWLRLRADTTEPGFLDARALTYAGRTFEPSPAEARQRRALVERTVALRSLR